MRSWLALAALVALLGGCADKTPPATGVDMTAAPTYEDVRWSVLLANAGNVSYEGVRVTIDVTPLSSGVTAHDEKTVGLAAGARNQTELFPTPLTPGDATFRIEARAASGQVLASKEGTYHKPCLIGAPCRADQHS